MQNSSVNQNSATESNPNFFVRRATSAFLNYLFSETRMQARREKSEARRKKVGGPHRVEYFHQLEDGYSHLTAQIVSALFRRYDIELDCHLVTGPFGDNSPEPDLLSKLSRHDAFIIAPEYGLDFPQRDEPPQMEIVDRALQILAAQDSCNFLECVADVGQAMWANDPEVLEHLAQKFGSVSLTEARRKVQIGTQRRADLNHYSGAMFHYGGEWYWGVDRLYHLEKRLASLGLDREPGRPLLMDRPAVRAGPLKDNGGLTLEVFPSLRSPYTAISFDRAVKLARDTGVNLKVRPVLPMIMRGVSATREKGMYIFMDAAREASEAGVPYGKFRDPIGEPVRRAYSLYPWAIEEGKEVEFISSFLNAAFAEGIDTNQLSGMRVVVERAGLDWSHAKRLLTQKGWESLFFETRLGNSFLGLPGWERMLEENRREMYASGLWGVPSFRLLNADGKEVLALWGQDRLWLIAREIQRQLERRT